MYEGRELGVGRRASTSPCVSDNAADPANATRAAWTRVLVACHYLQTGAITAQDAIGRIFSVCLQCLSAFPACLTYAYENP